MSGDYVLNFSEGNDVLSSASNHNANADANMDAVAEIISIPVVNCEDSGVGTDLVSILEKHNTIVKDLMLLIRKTVKKSKKKQSTTRRPYNVFLTEKLPMIKEFRKQRNLQDQGNPKLALKLCRAMWKDFKKNCAIDLNDWMETNASIPGSASK